MPERRKKFVLFTADGRLGNQLFEAAFLDSQLDDGDVIVATGMEEFVDGFIWNRFRLINLDDGGGPKRRKRVMRWLRRLGRISARLRLVGSIKQKKRFFFAGGKLYELAGEEILRRAGLSNRLRYIDKGYFQDAIHASYASFRLKDEHLVAARDFLNALPPGKKAFVHIRRGDYRDWTIFGRSPMLGIDYFRRGIEIIREAAPGAQFILVSDEPSEIDIPGLHVFQGANVYEDFGLMTLCDGGVVSNSTLSWWGGYFSHRTLPVVSPKGWLAHGLAFEYPVGITASWMTPIET